jgi:hypothetical protein
MTESYNGRNAAHFEHTPAHMACPLVHKQRRGVTATRPNPVPPPRGTSDSTSLDYLPDEVVDAIIGPVKETQRERLQLALVGQGKFRKALLRRWKTCSVLACGPSAVLVASHIVPWTECATNEERLDPDNGLLLTPNLDKLFDRRLISFKDSGEILVRPDFTGADLKALGVRPRPQASLHSGQIQRLPGPASSGHRVARTHVELHPTEGILETPDRGECHGRRLHQKRTFPNIGESPGKHRYPDKHRPIPRDLGRRRTRDLRAGRDLGCVQPRANGALQPARGLVFLWSISMRR